MRSQVDDIFFNFAVEEYMANQMHVAGPVLFLWRPNPVVTIGRHQNPWKECALANMNEDNTPLCRRYSGGGAIFMDLGCTTFTFMGPSKSFDQARNFEIVTGALREGYGIEASKTGRNDLTVLHEDGHDYKISGSAFKHVPDRGVSLHHGTVLVDLDMKVVPKYLTPNKAKLESKGISSVAARVMNLKKVCPEITHEGVCAAMEREFCRVHGTDEGSITPELLDRDSEMAQSAPFSESLRRMMDWDWNFGTGPAFSHVLETRIEGVGVFEVHLEVARGIVKDCVVFSDSLLPDVVDRLPGALRGRGYSRREVGEALQALAEEFAGSAGEVEAAETERRLETLRRFREWMVASLED